MLLSDVTKTLRNVFLILPIVFQIYETPDFSYQGFSYNTF